MKKNMGTIDKAIRIVLALVLVVLAFTVVTGSIAIILLAIAAVFIFTSLISFCPLYPIFGLNTLAKEATEDKKEKDTKL